MTQTKKIDRRTLYTLNIIKDSLLDALNHKSFEQITVTEVCRLAEVTRATFYLHYKSLTDVLDELITDALQMAEDDSNDSDQDIEQLIRLSHYHHADELREKESLLPVCHRVAHLPKYRVIFKDETLSSYVVNKIYQWQRKRLVPAFMKQLNLDKKEAELLLLFVINGTYSVNKALNWTKNDSWYKIQSMLLKHTAGGYERLRQSK